MNMKSVSIAVLLVAMSNAMKIQNSLSTESGIAITLPNKAEGAKVARTLVARESLMSVNTISRTSEGGIIPVSSMEYYADCDLDGNPYWLVVDIGSPYRNIADGSSYTISIRAGDHPINDNVDPSYPGGIVSSPAGSPRVNLRGKIENVTMTNPKEVARLSRCFLKRHPDSKWWLPTNVISPHKTHWVKFWVTDAYMVGGFGDRAYIGALDGREYHEAEILE